MDRLQGAVYARVVAAFADGLEIEDAHELGRQLAQLAGGMFAVGTPDDPLAGLMSSVLPGPGAGLVVVGAPRGTQPGRIGIGRLGERLLYGGGSALALAPKGYAGRPARIATVGVQGAMIAPAAAEFELAARLAGAAGATLVSLKPGSPQPEVDLLVLGSAHYAPAHGVLPDEAGEWALRTATCPVLVVPRERVPQAA
jgi:hypothetical protein